MEGTCGNATGTSAAGVITDGPGDYSASERCFWKITTSADVELKFQSFETEPVLDKLQVWSCEFWSEEMPCTNCDKVLASFDGSLGSFNFTASNAGGGRRCVTVAFYTDPMTQLLGFYGDWSLKCPPPQ
ncbi:hypothetical protein GUITHDRAFT_102876 [Guillardia theta CCMP2712]|uniref:CUB domain-containing protein n=1 Tax=Guillardia theta (strain CCMP2712) TaxID=905079 RepID=L1JTT4_GUITC|nr:hypothetical protein GUITHDRAFT_102876 [Guillardia theta CCMP2712]EKX51615.1 hypothetical protein GUITHDRAFT_102876 [Guillardia theta CCMP2712]|eukprot:XP_005838595.1 hypothetical protein GUITHDRAFT_102876 [Guillardia theta CCMP2712]